MPVFNSAARWAAVFVRASPAARGRGGIHRLLRFRTPILGIWPSVAPVEGLLTASVVPVRRRRASFRQSAPAGETDLSETQT